MCGITGFLTSDNSNKNELIAKATLMSGTLRSRGPDDTGAWANEKDGIALGHRRLSIIDLSSEAHQPMHSPYGRYVITYNGEIYNYRTLRKELERQAPGITSKFRSHSDTEVVLAALEQWGIEVAVKRFIGMFAFAIWDLKEKVLYLVRDRLGIKPLYYGWIGRNTFAFASELKAFKAYPGFQSEINRNALALMMRYSYIPAPYSIYKGIYKLLPGSIIAVTSRDLSANINSTNSAPLRPHIYWSAKEIAEEGLDSTFEGDEEEAIEQLDKLLRDAVGLRMISDVPLGAFLSGGIDSSTVVASMQAQSTRPVKTFSIGFDEADYNEAVYAKEVAKHLGTDHTELYVTPEEALAVIPELPTFYCEPFADASQIPTFLISRFARKHVTVSLSGDGGDELFGGYNRYFWGRSIWQKTGWMHPRLQKFFGYLLTSLTPETWNRIFESLAPVLPMQMRQRMPGDRIHKLAEVLGGKTQEDMYYRLISICKEPTKIVKDSFEPLTLVTDKTEWAELPDFIQMMMFLDMVSYLPDDILTKVDRASMAVSLEARVPFLDHRLVEFAWKIPLSMKIRNGHGKWLLRQVLYQYVPKELIERPKMGFGVPIDTWLRGPLRDWAESLIDEKRLQEEGYFDHKPIRRKWEEHLSGKRNWQYYLWNILMFQAWLEKN